MQGTKTRLSSIKQATPLPGAIPPRHLPIEIIISVILLFTVSMLLWFVGVTASAEIPKGAAQPEALLQPADFQYLGAFRLPGGFNRPLTFAYGGNAMTFNPNGDPSGPRDGYSGSLFISGHDRIAYGDLPDGGQIAEISIPVPVIARPPGKLKQARFLQPFHDVAAGYFTTMEELPRMGMQYLNTPATGPKIHLAWGQHFEPDPRTGTHAWFSPDLSAPDFRGTWFIGTQSFYSVNGFMFEIPSAFAAVNTQGRPLATGRFRDGGWSGMGPALFAYRPWGSNGAPTASGTHLPTTVLLKYQNSMTTEQIRQCLRGYQHPDEWEGGAWITTTTGKTAVLFAGTKGTGAKYWYGFANPAGPDTPCVAGDFVGQFPVCRMADGTQCPSSDLHECNGHNDFRGWWSARFDAEFILFNEADLALVAKHKMPPWKPQPYAVVDLDDHLYLNPSNVELDMLGRGVQRRYRLGDVAYDRAHDLLYVLELFADRTRPVVHVWRVR